MSVLTLMYFGMPARTRKRKRSLDRPRLKHEPRFLGQRPRLLEDHLQRSKVAGARQLKIKVGWNAPRCTFAGVARGGRPWHRRAVPGLQGVMHDPLGVLGTPA